MIICKDELRRMAAMSKRRERAFENLGQDISNLEAEALKQGIKPDHEPETSAAEKTQFALRRTQRETEAYERLFEDTCMSLGEVSRPIRGIQPALYDRCVLYTVALPGVDIRIGLPSTLNPTTTVWHHHRRPKPRPCPHHSRPIVIRPLCHTVWLLGHNHVRHTRHSNGAARHLVRLRQRRPRRRSVLGNRSAAEVGVSNATKLVAERAVDTSAYRQGSGEP